MFPRNKRQGSFRVGRCRAANAGRKVRRTPQRSQDGELVALATPPSKGGKAPSPALVELGIYVQQV